MWDRIRGVEPHPCGIRSGRGNVDPVGSGNRIFLTLFFFWTNCVGDRYLYVYQYQLPVFHLPPTKFTAAGFSQQIYRRRKPDIVNNAYPVITAPLLPLVTLYCSAHYYQNGVGGLRLAGGTTRWATHRRLRSPPLPLLLPSMGKSTITAMIMPSSLSITTILCRHHYTNTITIASLLLPLSTTCTRPTPSSPLLQPPSK